MRKNLFKITLAFVSVYMLLIPNAFGKKKFETSIVGYTAPMGAGNQQAGCDPGSITITCEPGSYSHLISGNLFIDFDENCSMDSVELCSYSFNYSQWSVMVRNDSTGLTRYAPFGADGKYYVCVDSSDYTVSVNYPKNLCSPTCSDTTSKSVSISTDTIGTVTDSIDFGFKALSLDPLLKVDVYHSRLRPCFWSFMRVEYQNLGLGAANNVTVKVPFDTSLFTITSSILDSHTVANDTLTIYVGTLASGARGYFSTYLQNTCDLVLGSTICTEAYIFPNNQTDTTGTWDKSSVQVTGSCVNDSLACFEILNTGETGGGDMAGPSQWRLYSDTTLIQTGNFQIDGKETLELCFNGDGSTFRLEADQRPGHPGNSHPNAHVELCGAPDSSLGFVTQYPMDDEDFSKSVICNEVTGSFDPNDKQVFPKGLGGYGYIPETQNLTYRIRFQNTGTDTAFNVFIIDTLDTDELDLSTFQVMSSSHNFYYSINGNVLRFDFKNILLPDSGTDQQGSNGYIDYRISQLANVKGDTITNKADIYFDFNAPVATNEVLNVVFDTVYSKNTFAFAPAISGSCIGDTARFLSNIKGGFGPFDIQWTLSDTTLSGATIERYYLDTTNEQIVLSVQDNEGNNYADTLNLYIASTPNAGFDWGSTQTDVQFTNRSLDSSVVINSSYWDFGDGDTSLQDSPLHVYPDSGTYTVCLTVTGNNGCMDTECQTIQIDITGLHEGKENKLTVYPNPFKEGFSFNSNSTVSADAFAKIVDPTGRMVEQISTIQTNTMYGESLNPGVYFIHVYSSEEDNSVHSFKIIKR